MEKILVRGVNWLGDAIMTIPAIRLIKKTHPDSLLHVLTLEHLKPVYELVPEISCILTFKKRRGFEGISERLATADALKQKKFSSCYIFPNSFDSALVPALAGIPVRRGFNKNLRGFLLTDKQKAPDDFFSEHHSNHYIKIVKGPLNGASADLGIRDLPLLKIGETRLFEFMSAFKANAPGFLYRKIYALCPGAEFGPSKKWPVERYREICKRILNWQNSMVIVLGTEADKKDGNLITDGMEKAFNLAGKTDLTQFIFCLAASSGVITNDSGAMHVAGALGKPVVAIFGSTSPLATKGLGNVSVAYEKVPCSPCFKRECRYGHYDCLRNVNAETVWERIKGWGETR